MERFCSWPSWISARTRSHSRRGPERPLVPPDHGCDGETVSPSPQSNSQTSAGEPVHSSLRQDQPWTSPRHTVELPKARRQDMPSDRTSRPALQAPDLLATLPARSGRRQNHPCRRHHECKLGDQTKDDADKEPREERSCGRSQTSLYNGTRTHLSLNKDAPISRVAEAAGRILCRPIWVVCITNMLGLDLRYAQANWAIEFARSGNAWRSLGGL